MTSMPSPDAALATALALAGAAIKAADLDAILRRYTRELTAVMKAALDRSITRSTGETRHRRLIRDLAEPAYVAGLRAGGVDEIDLTRSDRRAIERWVADQGAYVSGFWDAVAELRRDRPGLSRRDYAARLSILRERISLWAAALRDLAGQGIASARANMMVTWRYGDADHCDTCARLHGRRHRLHWFTDRGYIPQQPGSATLQCGGWRCRCTLVDDRGKVILPA